MYVALCALFVWTRVHYLRDIVCVICALCVLFVRPHVYELRGATCAICAALIVLCMWRCVRYLCGLVCNIYVNKYSVYLAKQRAVVTFSHPRGANRRTRS